MRVLRPCLRRAGAVQSNEVGGGDPQTGLAPNSLPATAGLRRWELPDEGIQDRCPKEDRATASTVIVTGLRDVPTVGGHCGIEHNVMQSLERHVVAYAEQMIDRALTLICTGLKRDEKIG
jgi:hypothetical protein